MEDTTTMKAEEIIKKIRNIEVDPRMFPAWNVLALEDIVKRLRVLEDAADRSWTEPRFIGDKNV